MTTHLVQGLAGGLTDLEAGWSASLRDRTPGAWIAIGLYFLNSFLCLRRSLSSTDPRSPGTEGLRGAIHTGLGAIRGVFHRKQPLTPTARTSALWFLLSGCMLILGTTRLLDLGNLLTVIGRHFALAGGWYSLRRILQVGIISLLALVGGGGILLILRAGRYQLWPLRVAMTGTVFVLCFAAIRACSYHHLDLLLGVEWRGIRLSWVLEIGGEGVIALAAASTRGRPP